MTANTPKKVYLGLSGGVDSAVCAAVLKDLGYEVTCVYMKCWGEGPSCAAAQDGSESVKVASSLELPFQTWDFTKVYRDNVLKSFIEQYSKGLTPNPDILCNSEVKFGAFYKKVKQIDKNALVATGHYARIIQDKYGFNRLASGLDKKKDQSYFLYKLSCLENVLNDCLFPVGEMTKVQVREYAKKLNLPNMDRPDSQGLCFIGDVNMRQFLSSYISKTGGDVVNSAGEVIGKHIGLAFYTIGQRHGFTVNNYHTDPLYVIGKSFEENRLIVGNRSEAFSKCFNVSGLIFIEEYLTSDLSVRVRNLGKNISCTLNSGNVNLKVLEFGIAPGQSAVFYHKDIVVGGGTISEITP
ncbi:tRNA 2-thiouridine(34) synthase MnmA [candidate division WWE3 bacterium CG10_big_fil_rev_8_21_14_0_10_35_32]|nr:MAG: tRNA 2-thiouridine(34) synthase MnmA [candidate division WWE3 bacterium CG10_big_fil_rev_8_21_14_0_10_35_32]